MYYKYACSKDDYDSVEDFIKQEYQLKGRKLHPGRLEKLSIEITQYSQSRFDFNVSKNLNQEDSCKIETITNISSKDNVEKNIIEKETSEALEKLLLLVKEKFGEKRMEMLVMKDIKDMTLREIADKFGCSREWVKPHRHLSSLPQLLSLFHRQLPFQQGIQLLCLKFQKVFSQQVLM